MKLKYWLFLIFVINGAYTCVHIVAFHLLIVYTSKYSYTCFQNNGHAKAHCFVCSGFSIPAYLILLCSTLLSFTDTGF